MTNVSRYKPKFSTGHQRLHMNDVSYKDYIKCDGSILNQSVYPDLFSSIGIIRDLFGEVWTARTSGTTQTIQTLTYGNGLYVYGGSTGILRTSSAYSYNSQTEFALPKSTNLSYTHGSMTNAYIKYK